MSDRPADDGSQDESTGPPPSPDDSTGPEQSQDGAQRTEATSDDESRTESSPDEQSPNPAQRELIESTDGTYLVDAGPGTGKTFALTRRYARIVDQPDVDPEDALLVTFTQSAATEMRERIATHSAHSRRELAEASIQTFHALCVDLLREHGARAPGHLGIDERVTASTTVLEDDVREADRFAAFLDGFRDDHPEHADHFRSLDDPDELRELIAELAAKGVAPTTDGWYRDGEAVLRGDREAFAEQFRAVNQPQGEDGTRQSELRSALTSYGKEKTYVPDAPARTEVRGDGTKAVPEDALWRAFEADREDLLAFVHDVYLEYLAFALSRNYLTFGFLQVLALALLYEDPSVRQRASFDYVMVDEFQDTSEVQFELALLLCGTDHFCVVGDWKQSIYAFQYAEVENVRSFEDRLRELAARLNDGGESGGADGAGAADGGRADAGDADELDANDADGTDARDAHGADTCDGDSAAETGRCTNRVAVDSDAVERIQLTENYRSTASILECSEDALVAPATDGEDVEESVLDDVVSLSSNAPFDRSRIEAVQHPEEPAAVLSHLQSIVGNEEYAVEDAEGEPRAPTYDDVAVLTRTRDFGRELLALAEAYDVPVTYDGGVELFRTDQAKLLLAWLRILASDDDRGWALVLEAAGYSLPEIDRLLDRGEPPEAMSAFRDRLASLDDPGAIARQVFDRYGFSGTYADVLVHEVRSLHDGSTMTTGDLARYLEGGVEQGVTREVATGAGDDAATVQTIHGAKGLEYPIVVLANVNDGSFPPRGGGSSTIYFDEAVGLRSRKTFADVEVHPHVFDEWSHDILRHCLPREYDEERRLLYVALTRAEHHVVCTAGKEPSAFFDALPTESRVVEPDVQRVDRGSTTQTELPFRIVPPDGPIGRSPHDLIDESVFDGSDESDESDGSDVADTADTADAADEPPATGYRGPEFGTRLHEFAEDYALGTRADLPGDDLAPDARHVATLLDGLDGELRTEERATLPLTVDGRRVTVSGVADLLHLTDDRVEVIDYKTARTRRAEPEYCKQVSVYYHVVHECFPDREASASLFYTADAERVAVEPLSIAALVAEVELSR